LYGIDACIDKCRQSSLDHMDQPNGDSAVPTGVRILFGVFGFVFGGIGVAVLIFMWTASGWDAPPLFFRVVASFIAIAFVAFGGTMLFATLRGRPLAMRPPPRNVGTPRTGPAVGYTCPSCGATLGKDADVSPLGDVKCTFCARWFNVHRAS
jgi:hypothetical protein